MALTGRSLSLPVWAVAEIESRLNRVLGISHLPPGAALAVGEIDLALDRDFTPRFRLRDLRLIEPSGRAILALPELAVALDPTEALRGRMRPTSVRISARILRRSAMPRAGSACRSVASRAAARRKAWRKCWTRWTGCSPARRFPACGWSRPMR
ncbi:MAG: hypothetical protein IPF96_08470 [Rhodobacter sp.]|nr:hypothetical protein [Rhodobacter sp.]